MKHKSTLQNLFLLMVMGLLLPSNLKASELRVVSAEGVAAVVKGNKALARDRAIEDALRKAVEQSVGTIIDNETIVSNYQVLSDSIYSKSQGYIQSYAIVDEYAGEDVFRVTIEAVVTMGNLEEDLQAISTLLQRIHKPRLLVLIKLDAPGWGYRGQGQLNPAENAIMETFREKGFDLVDRLAVISGLDDTQPKDLDQLVANRPAAAGWALQQGAEIAVIGRAVVNKTSLPMLGTMNSYQASISLSAVKTDTGEVMASGSEQDKVVHIDDLTGSQQAVEKAAAKLGPQLVANLTNKFRQEVSQGTTVKLVVHGVNDQQLVSLKNALGQQVRGIQPGSIHQRVFANGIATLDVQIQGNAQFLADELTRKDFPTFQLSLTKFSSNKLELKFIPKGSLPGR